MALTPTPVRGPAGVAVRYGGASDPGPVRSLNEDAWLAAPPVFVVADGMGGHRAGDAASGIVVERFAELAAADVTPDVESVERCVSDCQQRINDLGRAESAPPGSTLIAATLVEEDRRAYWLVTNVGDSRAYLLHDAGLEQLSHDHSVVQELLDAGSLDPAEAATHPERHVITRALGGSADYLPDHSLIPVAPGQRLLLGSDGVVGELTGRSMGELLGTIADPQAAAEALVAAALSAGGRDNATAVVVDVVHGGDDPTDDTRPHAHILIDPWEESE